MENRKEGLRNANVRKSGCNQSFLQKKRKYKTIYFTNNTWNFLFIFTLSFVESAD